jgi:hypothetical protein
MCDFQVQNHGTVYMLVPVSLAALEWVEEHTPADAMRLGRSVAVEHRFIEDIVDGIEGDGLAVTYG